MKINELKKLVKSAVKEAIQEELKEILLEAVKSPKVVTESFTPPQMEKKINVTPTKTREELRESYQNILGETAKTFNTSNVGRPLQVTSMDTTSPNGQLPAGEVGLDQIQNLMNSKG